MSRAKVTVIIPAYNAESTLHDCLDSAINQTLRDIEILCIDDCSHDSSSIILSYHSERDKRIRLIKHSSNKGEGAARNTGIDNAEGEYVFHLDADDTIPIDALEILYTEANSSGSDMVKGRFDIIHKGGEIQLQDWSTPPLKVVNTNIYESQFLQKIPTSHCSYLYKREFLNQHNIRYRTDMVVGLDLIALTTALIFAKKVTLIPNTVYHYHQTDNSAIRGPLTTSVAIDAIRSRKIINDLLITSGLKEAAYLRLKFWEYIITTYWRRMPSSLTTEQSSLVFAKFRKLINNNKVVPWTVNTPINYRYILALVLGERDSEALSFLQSNDAIEGPFNQHRLKKSLAFILTQAPRDIGTLMELGHLEKSEGNLEKALHLFEEASRTDTGHLESLLKAVETLILLKQYDRARQKLTLALDTVSDEQGTSGQIRNIITAKDNLELAERKDITKKLEITQEQLNAVYTSSSWKITTPLRKIKSILKRLA